MGDSLGVSDPQTVFLSRVSHVEIPIGGGTDIRCFRIYIPREVLSSARCCRTCSDNGSRALLPQHLAKTTYGLQRPMFPCMN